MPSEHGTNLGSQQCQIAERQLRGHIADFCVNVNVHDTAAKDAHEVLRGQIDKLQFKNLLLQVVILSTSELISSAENQPARV